ncbi:hypothetical protein [Yersinia aleksiciae]|uniref:Uncharacterized protein n=1 Tax=Yersinia aleksiciae TaxID=263819 RepID=A0A0T9U9S5_YERAE|nr:hypothetical protein [Yersinia aleksiciae]AKP33529.1 hypothetical protein ACZ76_08255 [Yersinia aleksiciae]MDA5496237.1 hypothetical protein [Yersinia aleksiciae]NIL00510.1 hypothetical protein [Yersinia aleksiciae]WQC70633.1 hypothetical protein N0K21_18790 [Yersinia aleksiciae]CFQ40508.1 Uncharacterised protein [Yersinia aleksiciae]
MKKLSIFETKKVSGGDSGRELAQAAGSVAGGAIGGRLGGSAGMTGGAALGGVVGGRAYDAASNAINSSPQITIPAMSYDPATLGRPAYLSGPDSYYICRMTGKLNCG